MVVAMVAGLVWASTGLALPAPVNDTLTLLGAAATPGALFAIGASLADKRVERLGLVTWLTFVKTGAAPCRRRVVLRWSYSSWSRSQARF